VKRGYSAEMAVVVNGTPKGSCRLQLEVMGLRQAESSKKSELRPQQEETVSL
jgi:hypothetical protein